MTQGSAKVETPNEAMRVAAKIYYRHKKCDPFMWDDCALEISSAIGVDFRVAEKVMERFGELDEVCKFDSDARHLFSGRYGVTPKDITPPSNESAFVTWAKVTGLVGTAVALLLLMSHCSGKPLFGLT